jgi:uncharacterized protein
MRLKMLLAGLTAALSMAATGAWAQSYDGDWEGVLQAGPQKLRLELHVKTEGGNTSAVLDSLDQGASIPATAAKVENGELGILFLAIGGELKGKLAADGKSFTGAWTQGREMPLTMTRKAAK